MLQMKDRYVHDEPAVCDSVNSPFYKIHDRRVGT